ncbi:MAG TPA: SDR family oxidoreductase [Anaerolineales bacterium]|nr:SDR family oxidoreductase [Anaerolineales bacterium]
MKALITGANRGIGLEFVRQLIMRDAHVFAACRNPSKAGQLLKLQEDSPQQISIIKLDVTDDKSLSDSHNLVSSKTNGLDLLVNNAAVSPVDKGLGTFDSSTIKSILAVNTVAPILVIQQFAQLLKKGEHPRIVNISSGLGSLNKASESSTKKYASIYSSSKAALNMSTIQMAHELADHKIIVVSITPGWVKTDMGGPNADIDTNESVSGMLQVIDYIQLEDTGRFYDYTGKTIPW